MAKKPTKEQIINDARTLADSILKSIEVITTESETDPVKVLDSVGELRDRGRLGNLQRLVRDRSLDLFEAKK